MVLDTNEGTILINRHRVSSLTFNLSIASYCTHTYCHPDSECPVASKDVNTIVAIHFLKITGK